MNLFLKSFEHAFRYIKILLLSGSRNFGFRKYSHLMRGEIFENYVKKLSRQTFCQLKQAHSLILLVFCHIYNHLKMPFLPVWSTLLVSKPKSVPQCQTQWHLSKFIGIEFENHTLTANAQQKLAIKCPSWGPSRVYQGNIS